MKFGVIVFPGSNCDHDTYHVIRDVMGQEVAYLWHQETDLQDCDVVIVPGGFSYGDYLRSGAIAKFSPIMESVRAHAAAGGLVAGICNGFQILQEMGMLAGAMLPNAGLKFVCRYVHIRIENAETPLTLAGQCGQVLRLPVAHHDGNFFTSSEDLSRLQDREQIVFRYCDAEGRRDPSSSPNGSLDDIAGVCSPERNVLALMPHPERASEALLGCQDGRLLFQSLIQWVGEHRADYARAR